ncbi:conjugative coupling factor TraD, PFGI-1 class [Ectothiorhodospira shaposhnikovii]|uniref:type IV conjugative transfer system coupling protein TraD n=1 Tax=Ectothiorhodospira shaposhnikovii TaxID=1054 RepID=UPI00190697F3|nr:type IV conjugative transfer system coupling protein TraD [Ectothiorhodospira shaposhnikovii]MBK1674712.1 conjugative coupling factor TraD, PFGI-1 class [Ectothiorhodospira shaposhnikovii]
MSRHPVEALLRPPVELWSAFVAGLSAVVALAAPWALMMTPAVAWVAATVLGGFALYRGRQGWQILRYQRNLKRLPEYRLTADRIPVSRRKLFLGLGFAWTQKHTQRLRDTIRPEVRRYLRPGGLYRWARAREVAWEHTPGLSWIATRLGTRAWWNPLAPLPPVGGKPALHGVEPEESAVWMDIAERVGHALVLGTTRVGKTRLAEILITQDIRRGDVVIVFDPKGDADLLRRMYAECKRSGREHEFYMFHLGHPDISARYNAIGAFNRITEVATRIANQLPSEGNSAAFKEFAWRFSNIIAQALVALGRRPDYTQIVRHITNIESLFNDYCSHWLPKVAPQDWQQEVAARESRINDKNVPFAMKGRSRRMVALVQYLKDNALYDPVADGLRSAVEYDKTYFDKIVASLLPLLEKLTTGKTAELISPDYFDIDDPRPIFDWMQVVRRKCVVYVGLDALSDMTVAGAVGNSMFADLVSVAGQVYKFGTESGLPTLGPPAGTPTISVHADEFNELIGDEFIPLLNKAGGAGFQVTAYTQTWSDVEARIGNRAKAGQVAGNFNTLIMLRVKEFATAEMLTEQLPQVEIFSLMQVSGTNDSADPGSEQHFTSRNEDRISVSEVPLLTPADIVTLPKGQAFALIEGGQLYKIRMPLPDTRKDPKMPDSLQQIATEMSRRYSTGDQWWITEPIPRAPGGLATPVSTPLSPRPSSLEGAIPAEGGEP